MRCTHIEINMDQDQGKRELTALLTKVLETEDVDEANTIFQTIVDRSNQLRRQYGLPVKVDDKEISSVLKTNTEQLELVGAKSEVVNGTIIYERAIQRKVGQRPTLFEQSFVRPEKSTQFQSIIMNNVNHNMPVEKVYVFPPLLLRSAKQGRAAYHVDEKSQLSDTEAKPNLLVIFSDDGPIVPVVDVQCLPRMKRIIERIYSLTGICNVSNFKIYLEG